MLSLASFLAIWLVDFEFYAPDGELPRPVCLVAYDLVSGREIRLWLDGSYVGPCPYSTDEHSLFVAYFASAELSCHLALGWPLPVHVLDLYVEFRNFTNNRPHDCGNGLLGALTFFGLSGIRNTHKEAMRSLAMCAGPYSDKEQKQLLDYCASDVDALRRLFPHMEPHLDLERALLLRVLRR